MAFYNNDDGEHDKKSSHVRKQQSYGPNVLELLNSTNEAATAPDPVMQSPEEMMSGFSEMRDQQAPTPAAYNTGDMFSYRVSAGEEPVRDAAQAQRLAKMAKFNALSKGLQAVFGAAIAAGGDVAPAPYDSPLTQQISGAIQQMDDKYYRDLAKFRDQQFRAELVNMDQQNRADQARAAQMRYEIEAAKEQGRYEDAQKRQKELDDFNQKIQKSRLALQGRGQALREREYDLDVTKQFNYGRNNQIQTVDAYDDAIRREQETLKAMYDNFADEQEIAQQNLRIRSLSDDRDNLIRQLSGKEGFQQSEKRTESPQGQEHPLERKKKEVVERLNTGAYKKNPEVAKEEIMQIYLGSGMDEKTAEFYTEKDLRNHGLIGKDEMISAPRPEDYDSQLDYTAAKQKYDESSRKRAEQSAISEKRSQLENSLGGAMEMIGRSEVSSDISSKFKSNPKEATREAIKLLRKELNTIAPYEEDQFTSPGIGGQYGLPKQSDRYRQKIAELESILEDLKNHEEKYGN